MNFSASFTNKLIAISLYTALLLVTVSAGVKTINFALDQKFTSTFILGWQQAILNLQEKEPVLPPMNDGQLVTGMNNIEQLAKKHYVSLPSTNTSHAYAHILKKLNQPQQRIFLIVKHGRIIIYGMSQQTMQHADKQIDGVLDTRAGKFTARSGKNRGTYTGILTL